MKLSLNWLSDFVDFSENDPQKIAEVITLSVAEVEEIEIQGAMLDNCCVGKVIKIKKHPNADKLQLCDVETDKGMKRVVCGGSNLSEGMLVAFAHVGANVKWHGEEMMELTKVKIRGEESEGMICAASELGLDISGSDREIIDLGSGKWQVGSGQLKKPLKEALGLSDTILHIDNHSLTHRADLFSHSGFARECRALGLAEWKKDKPEYKDHKFSKESLPFKNVVDCKELIPRYCACLLKIDGVGETPDWMKKRLEAIGLRSLNLPIDITNYVMMDVGMPLHSFDADDIVGDIHIRLSKKGEKIVTLDKEERELPDGSMVLSDDGGIFDLLGIMGGIRSSTKERTTQIYLHSAGVDPIPIRKTIIATGHRTDAATIYEKGIPNVIVREGFNRALQLFLDLVPGAQIISQMESHGDDGEERHIQLSLKRASSLLGKKIAASEAQKSLEALDFSVTKGEKDTLDVGVPFHRLGDINKPVDLIEEIARMFGFKKFEEEMPEASIVPPKRNNGVNLMRTTLKEAGFSEIVRFSFLGEELLTKSNSPTDKLDEIDNPLGEDIKYMRPSLTPRLLEFASENMKHVTEDLRAFEVGGVFGVGEERQLLTAIFASKSRSGLKSEPFLKIKSAVRELFGSVNLVCSFKKQKTSTLVQHPARSVDIYVGDKKIGALYEVHPTVIKNFALPGRAAVAVIEVDTVIGIDVAEKVYKEVSEYPSITYDVTVSPESSVEVEGVLEKVRGSHELLQDVRLADLFQKDNERQLTFRCTYGSFDRTLTEEEVRPVHEKVEATLRG